MEISDDVLKALSRAVTEEQARLRWLMMSVVSGAIKLSETELMEATRDVMGLQNDARLSAEHLRAVSGLVGRQSELTAEVFGYPERYAQEATGRLKQQVEVSDRAVNLTDKIGGFVGEIGKISNAVRVLTINGYIESTRLGGEGRAFAVIAEQLQDLGEKVRSANEGIRDLTSGLGKIISQIGESARLLLRQTEQMESEHSDAMFMYRGASSDSRREIANAIDHARERSQDIAGRSMQILGHLQFQDRMAQQLREIEQMAARAETTIAAMFEEANPNQEGEEGRPIFARRKAAAEQPAPVNLPQAGDTMLFD